MEKLDARPRRSSRALAGAALLLLLVMAPPSLAEEGAPPNDLLEATLWMQRSVEYKGNALTAFALARLRLDQALADPNWTAAPAEQTGAYQNLPPAVVLDLDETLLDNSGYQAWMVMKDKTFEPKTWTAYVNAQVTLAIPGAIDFAKYADGKGVKVFYVSNRNAAEKPATRQNMEKLGFPMGGNVDTILAAGEKPDWGSAKGTRRAAIAKDYRILLNLGDNFGDFTDAYKGTEEERLKVFEANRERWGREWIVLANPSYGSFDSAPFKHDFKQPPEAQRQAKRNALQPWSGP
jgi:5'-nucleotidase (lipoprotein e(P4) family)